GRVVIAVERDRAARMLDRPHGRCLFIIPIGQACVAARHVVVRGRLVALFALFPVVRAGLFAFLDGEPDAGAVLADRGVWLADRADVLVDHGPGRLVRPADRTAPAALFL